MIFFSLSSSPSAGSAANAAMPASIASTRSSSDGFLISNPMPAVNLDLQPPARARFSKPMGMSRLASAALAAAALTVLLLVPPAGGVAAGDLGAAGYDTRHGYERRGSVGARARARACCADPEQDVVPGAPAYPAEQLDRLGARARPRRPVHRPDSPVRRYPPLPADAQ